MKKILVMKLGFMVKCEAESNKYADVSGTDNQSSVLLKSVLSIGLQTKDIDRESVSKIKNGKIIIRNGKVMLGEEGADIVTANKPDFSRRDYYYYHFFKLL